jgi:hypothetical protein
MMVLATKKPAQPRLRFRTLIKARSPSENPTMTGRRGSNADSKTAFNPAESQMLKCPIATYSAVLL